jgi:hypothetical protein
MKVKVKIFNSSKCLISEDLVRGTKEVYLDVEGYEPREGDTILITEVEEAN